MYRFVTHADRIVVMDDGDTVVLIIRDEDGRTDLLAEITWDIQHGTDDDVQRTIDAWVNG